MMKKRIKGKIQFKELILKETPDYIIINKPPYLSTLDDRNDPQNILALAKSYCEDAQVCHRLDKETSGVLVIAKKPEAYRHFAINLERRQVKKVYHAVLNGIHHFEDVEAAQPIYSSNSKSRVDFRQGKPSLTLISTLEHFRTCTLVKCFPVTGRLHQIRAHLAFLEAPIACDPAYGGDYLYLSSIKRKYHIGKDREERPLIQRVALHAHSIAFRENESEEAPVISVEAPYPKDFEVLMKQLKKNC